MNSLMQKHQPIPTSEPWRMLFFLLMAQLLIAFVGRSIGPLGVLIGEDLSLTNSQIGMLPAALFLGQSVAAVPAGMLTDRVGSRKLLVVAALCLGLGFFVMTFLGQFWAVLLFVMLGGIGYGAMHPITNKGIIYWFSVKKRGTAMGIKQTGVTAGSALAGLILLPLGAEYGWRPVLLGACILLMVGGFLAYLFYRDPPDQTTATGEHGLGAFYKSMFKMMKNKALMLVSLSAIGLSGAQMCLNTYIVLYAHQKLGISIFLSGILLVISEVSGSLGRIAWGMISDFLFNSNRVIILIIITILTAVSSTTVAFASSASFWMMVPIVVVFGFSVSGFNGIWMNLATEIVPREQSGISSGVSLTFGSLGVVLVPPLFGLLVDQTGSFASGWLLITALMVLVFTMLAYLSFKKEA
ncbi:Sugar phosphate permease [Mesobacillus persicus]|uniref:Sugar phosphate permease n=1 Tax=Mesobacillus persicus TaxID=930146 RepID=A0A1H8G631_9BACI|nr:MFS transporter [Mesobacillus persicus]SEN39210.1 Sugar phosphate permease [Mesobacillus persicus]